MSRKLILRIDKMHDEEASVLQFFSLCSAFATFDKYYYGLIPTKNLKRTIFK